MFSWKDVPYYIGVAKARRADSDDAQRAAPIVIDLGPLTFVDNPARLPVAYEDVKKIKDGKVRIMLGFSLTEEAWSAFLFLAGYTRLPSHIISVGL